MERIFANVAPPVSVELRARRLPESLTGDEYLRTGRLMDDSRRSIQSCVPNPGECAVCGGRESAGAIVCGLMGRGWIREMGELMYQSHYGYSECGLGEAADYRSALSAKRGGERIVRREDHGQRRGWCGGGVGSERCGVRVIGIAAVLGISGEKTAGARRQFDGGGSVCGADAGGREGLVEEFFDREVRDFGTKPCC